MEYPNMERAVRLLDQAISMQSVLAGHIQEAAGLLRIQYSKGRNGKIKVRLAARLPHVDHATLTVRWKGLVCNLGATLPLRLLDRLCRRPNCFVCHENLLQDVWQGARKSTSTVRSTIRRLKSRLRDAGMGDLACRIRCEGGRYAFMLETRQDQIAQKLHQNAP